MVKPNEGFDQMQQNIFIADKYIAVFFGISNYGAAGVGETQIHGPALDVQTTRTTLTNIQNHPQAQADCQLMKESLKKFGVLGKDPKIYDLSMNPTEEQFKDVDEEIETILREGSDKRPMVRYMVLWFFAGQGILKEGKQCLLFNEVDMCGKFHKWIDAESRIKELACDYPNTYHFGMFACSSRELSARENIDILESRVIFEDQSRVFKESLVQDNDQSQLQQDKAMDQSIQRKEHEHINLFGNVIKVEQPFKSHVQTQQAIKKQRPINKSQDYSNKDKEHGSATSSPIDLEQKEVEVDYVDSQEDAGEEEDIDPYESQFFQSTVMSQVRLRPSIFANIAAKRKHFVFRQRNGFRKVPNGRDLYEIKATELGKGGFGTVYEATFKESDEVCACKVMNKQFLENKSDKGLLMAKREIEALEQMAHPNIVRVLDLCEDNCDFFIVMELVADGNLLELMQDRLENPLSEEQVSYIIQQILLAINYIHNHNMVHRDLKPENVLIELTKNEDGSEDITCKLTDFGLVFEVKKGEQQTEKVGTDTFMAPEVIKGNNQTSAVDIWSLGVIMFIMLTSNVPFKGKDRERKFENICNRPLDFNEKKVKPKFDALLNEGELAKDFISKCLNKDHPEQRPTAEELLQHEWIKLGGQLADIDDAVRLDTGVEMYTSKHNSAFQTCVLSFLIGVKSTKKQLNDLGAIFKSMDKNNDGYLSPEEMQEGMRNKQADFKSIIGQVPDWKSVFESIGTNKEGLINFAEFITAASNRLNFLKAEENLKLAFDHLDINKDGRIDIEEMRQALAKQKNTQEDTGEYKGETTGDLMNQMFSDIDKDQNGEIDYEEFRDHMLMVVKRDNYSRPASQLGAESQNEEYKIDLDTELLDNQDDEYLDEVSDPEEVIYSVDTAVGQRTNYVFLLLNDSSGQDGEPNEEDEEELQPALTDNDNENDFVRDVVDLLTQEFDRSTLSVTIPKALQTLTARSCDYQIVKPDHIQPIRLNFEHNTVRKAIAMIFVNESIESQYGNYGEEQKQSLLSKFQTAEMPGTSQVYSSSASLPQRTFGDSDSYIQQFSPSVVYKDAKKCGEDARKLFGQVLNFDHVEVHTNLLKKAVVEQLNKLHQFAETFKNKNQGQHCVISIIWVGNSINRDYECHKILLQELETTHNYALPQDCQDGSSHPQKYALTVNGEPLCIQEYADWIAATSPTTHVISFDPVQEHAIEQLDSYHVCQGANFHEIIIPDSRSGRCRHTSIHSGDITELYHTFKERRHKYNRHIFQFPYHLSETKVKIMNWGFGIVQEQFIFDLRDKITRRLMNENKPIQTFKATTEVFEQRPQLIYCEQVNESINWNPSVHQLHKQNQIVYIGASTNDEEGINYVNFTFWTGKEPHRRHQMIKHKMQHYNAATIIPSVSSLSKPDKEENVQENENSLVAIMYTSILSREPFKFVKFSREHARAKWSSEEVQVTQKFTETTCVRSCNKVNGNVFFIATMHYLVFFTKKLKEMARIAVANSRKSLSGSQIEHLTTCTPSLKKNEFIYGVKVNMIEKEWHCILKGKLNVKGPQIELEMSQQLLKTNEIINYVLEYANEKYVVHALPATILIVHQAEIIRTITDPSPSNDKKNLLLQLPGFDENQFPFMVSTGNENLSLINVNTGKTQVLIEASVFGVGPQQTVFFQKEDFGFNLIFATRVYTKYGELEFRWHKMEVKQDMIRLLSEYGQLPFVEPEESLKVVSKLMENVSQQETKISEQAKRIEELEKLISQVKGIHISSFSLAELKNANRMTNRISAPLLMDSLTKIQSEETKTIPNLQDAIPDNTVNRNTEPRIPNSKEKGPNRGRQAGKDFAKYAQRRQ